MQLKIKMFRMNAPLTALVHLKPLALFPELCNNITQYKVAAYDISMTTFAIGTTDAINDKLPSIILVVNTGIDDLKPCSFIYETMSLINKDRQKRAAYNGTRFNIDEDLLFAESLGYFLDSHFVGIVDENNLMERARQIRAGAPSRAHLRRQTTASRN